MKNDSPVHMLDALDRKIIAELSKSSSGSYRHLAKRMDMHPNTLINRMRMLEKQGVIKGCSANIDLSAMGYDFMAAVQVSISKGALIKAQAKISKFKGVVMVLDVTGEYDSLVLIACKNRAELSRLIKRILSIDEVERTNTHVILNVVKDYSEFIPE